MPNPLNDILKSYRALPPRQKGLIGAVIGVGAILETYYEVQAWRAGSGRLPVDPETDLSRTARAASSTARDGSTSQDR
jgi:hypothetical protein